MLTRLKRSSEQYGKRGLDPGLSPQSEEQAALSNPLNSHRFPELLEFGIAGHHFRLLPEGEGGNEAVRIRNRVHPLDPRGFQCDSHIRVYNHDRKLRHDEAGLFRLFLDEHIKP